MSRASTIDKLRARCAGMAASTHGRVTKAERDIRELRKRQRDREDRQAMREG